jgi:hypothetical protein
VAVRDPYAFNYLKQAAQRGTKIVIRIYPSPGNFTDALQPLLSGPTSHNLIATPGVKAASAGYCDIVTRKRKDGSIVRTAQAYEFYLDVRDIASELSHRLIRIFLRAEDGRRPVYGGQEVFQSDPHWRDYLQFHEYFHGDNGAGLGASHQTGWTALVAKLIQQSG